MKQKKVNMASYQFIFLVISIGAWFMIALALYKQRVEEKALILCGIIIVIVFYSFMAYTVNKNRCACKQTQGSLLQHNVYVPLFIQVIYMVLVSMLNIYNVLALWNGNTQLIGLTVSFILSTNVISLYSIDIIIIEEKRIYFHHKWILYEDIRKIDTDHTTKKYTVVYIFEKKMYTQRLYHPRYQEFKKIVQQYYHNVYNDTECQV